VPAGAPVWAYFRYLSDKELFAAPAHMTVEEVLFTINWRAGLDTTHVIRYNGTLYDNNPRGHVRGVQGGFDDICEAA
jgi:head-tail adaptor